MRLPSISIPSLVRIKPAALDRVGIYLARQNLRRVALVAAADLGGLADRLQEGMLREGVKPTSRLAAEAIDFAQTTTLFTRLPADSQAVVGLGGGRTLDIAKYLAFLAGVPFYAVPTSLSNDGFCSPQASLTVAGERRSLPVRLPAGVVIDTEVCLQAPPMLWLSGVGDLVAKVTAVLDWKLAFHHRGTAVDDFAALLSDATVFQFMARPERDLEGVRLLGTALMLNGIAMEIAGSSRPASGSEHLLSHALDRISRRPRLHGLQVGVATYLVSRLHGRETERIDDLLQRSGFWKAVAEDPFSRDEWLEAARLAPSIKEDFYTVLHSRDCLPEIERLLREDRRLADCMKP